MTFKEIKELIKLVDESTLREVRLKNDNMEIRIRTEHDAPASTTIAQPAFNAPVQEVMPPMPPTGQLESNAAEEPEHEDKSAASQLLEIKSPMVGTFYRSPSPDKPTFVQVGDNISKGDVVCVIEAMKLFNEIESEIAGRVVKVLVEDASPVEYDQVLFLVDPMG